MLVRLLYKNKIQLSTRTRMEQIASHLSIQPVSPTASEGLQITHNKQMKICGNLSEKTVCRIKRRKGRRRGRRWKSQKFLLLLLLLHSLFLPVIRLHLISARFILNLLLFLPPPLFFLFFCSRWKGVLTVKFEAGSQKQAVAYIFSRQCSCFHPAPPDRTFHNPTSKSCSLRFCTT